MLLENVFKDLLCIVGIAFLVLILLAICISAINEIKMSIARNNMIKELEKKLKDIFEKDKDK